MMEELHKKLDDLSEDMNEMNQLFPVERMDEKTAENMKEFARGSIGYSPREDNKH
jgi:hypothetical protein